MPSSDNRWNRPEHGATLVELSIVIVLLIAILLGMVQFSRALRRSEILSSAAREGARVASAWSLAHDTTDDTVYEQFPCGMPKLGCDVSPEPDPLSLQWSDCNFSPRPNLVCVAVGEASRYLRARYELGEDGCTDPDSCLQEWRFLVRICSRTEPPGGGPDAVTVDAIELAIERASGGDTWTSLFGSNFESGSAAFILARDCS